MSGTASATPPILLQRTGPVGSRILAFGSARGDLVVDNDAIVGPIDSSDEWIRQRTGVITRTRASAGVLAIDLATDAARDAIAASGIDPSQIDLKDARLSGLREALKVLEEVEHIRIIKFEGRDVVRHRVVRQIIEAYEHHRNASTPDIYRPGAAVKE